MAVPRLWVARRAVVGFPLRIRVTEQSGLAIRLRQARIRSTGSREVAEELHDHRIRRAIDRRRTESRERHDEAVELATPVVHPVVAGVGDQHVQAVTAVGEVAGTGRCLRRRGVVGVGIQPAVGVQVVVQLQVVVAFAAEEPVVPGTAEQNVVAAVAEDPVLTVLDQLARGVEAVEVQYETGDLRQRVVRVVEGLLHSCEWIDPVVDRQIPVVTERVDGERSGVVEEHGERFRPGDGVDAGAAVEPVVAQPPVNDVGVTVGPSIGGAADGEIDRLLEQAGDVHDRPGPRPGETDGRLNGGDQAVERLGLAIAAHLDETVVAEDAVLAGAAEDFVEAGAADEIVVPAIAVQNVVAELTVDEVVAVLAVDQIGAAEVSGPGDAGGVVE